MNTKTDVLCVSGATFLRLPAIDTTVAVDVTDITDASAVKDKLVKLYGAETVIKVDGRDMRICDIMGARRVEVGAQPEFDKPRYNIADAERVINRLMRKPDGCPWDSVQTHESIRINMIEEAYEAVDAINKRDMENMTEEFGDVLLQSLLQSAIAKREGEFDFDDVCDGLCKKLIMRHTFIFGSDSASNADDALTLWDRNKSVEKHYSGVKQQLQSLPDTFPSLLRCQKAFKKMRKAGIQSDPKKELDDALENKDYGVVIAACTALLSVEGKDAEVELDRIVRDKIDKL